MPSSADCQSDKFSVYVLKNISLVFLPPADEVWGEVMCLQVCVCPRGWVPGPGGVRSQSEGGAWSRGVGVGCLVLRTVSGPEGAWWTPPKTATAAGSTYPTGMHSCLKMTI